MIGMTPMVIPTFTSTCVANIPATPKTKILEKGSVAFRAILMSERINTAKRLKVTMTPENEGLCLCIEDDGKPFNPVEFEAPDVACSIQECKIGGLGIHIIRKLMDDICYERCEDKNVLKLKKGLLRIRIQGDQ